jgi:mannose-1-phosphate guanylyltransferase
VLLAGGAGTCLWPFSRKTVLKQFSTLIGTKAFFKPVHSGRRRRAR